MKKAAGGDGVYIRSTTQHMWGGGSNVVSNLDHSRELLPDVALPETQLGMDQVFTLLLEASNGALDQRIPVRASASPINKNIQLFYVKPQPARKIISQENEMRIKYNNVVRSKIWWSPEHDYKLGVVSRAMSMKTRSESHELERSFSHGFQGHWASLLMRDNVVKETDKAVLRTYVQEDVPGLVQFWAAQPKVRKTTLKAKSMSKAKVSAVGTKHIETNGFGSTASICGGGRLADVAGLRDDLVEGDFVEEIENHYYDREGQRLSAADFDATNRVMLADLGNGETSRSQDNIVDAFDNISIIDNSDVGAPMMGPVGAMMSSTLDVFAAPQPQFVHQLHRTSRQPQGSGFGGNSRPRVVPFLAPKQQQQMQMEMEMHEHHQIQRQMLEELHSQHGFRQSLIPMPASPKPSQREAQPADRRTGGTKLKRHLSNDDERTSDPKTIEDRGLDTERGAGKVTGTRVPTLASRPQGSLADRSKSQRRPEHSVCNKLWADDMDNVSDSGTSSKNSSPRFVTNVDLELVIECILEGDNTLVDGAAHGRNRDRLKSDSSSVSELNQHDQSLDLLLLRATVDDNASNLRRGNSHSSSVIGNPRDASVVAFELFKNACDIMDAHEFSVWYQRHVSKLFERNTALDIKRCLDNNDPRLSPDFLFPNKGSVGFLLNQPIAYGLFRGTYASGWELVRGSKELAALTGYDHAENIFYYESILESKVLDLFGHLVYKKKVSDGSVMPNNYFFQTIANVRGKRSVFRVHCAMPDDNEPMNVRMQDVSELYGDLLTLPKLPY